MNSRPDLRDFSREVLVSVKKFLKYKDLQKYTGLSPPILWRYIVNGMRPSRERAEHILRSLIEGGVLRNIILKNIRIIGKDIVDIYDLIYNKDLVKLAGYEAYYYFKDLDIDAVATVEVDGIPVAVATAFLFDAELIVAKRRKELGYNDYYEETYLSRDPPFLTSIYVPKAVIKKNYRILIVDDLLRSGRTLSSLINIIRDAKAYPVGVFSIVAIGNEWVNVIRKALIDKVHVMVHLLG
ncbi:MAG: adenine phosphoribosyltransferase [Desulfurococcales archaeon]|nr:adenine phosphoribosyltransferase [Desulfurococcales archaeon]